MGVPANTLPDLQEPRFRALDKQLTRNRKGNIIYNTITKGQLQILEKNVDKEIKSLDYKHMLLTLRLTKKLAYVRGIQKSLKKQRERRFVEDSADLPFGVYGGRPLYSYRYEVDQIIKDKHPRVRRLKQVERYMANGKIRGRIIDEDDAKRQFKMIMDDFHKPRPTPRRESPLHGFTTKISRLKSDETMLSCYAMSSSGLKLPSITTRKDNFQKMKKCATLRLPEDKLPNIQGRQS
ncbi:hypothetical protein CHS0354_040176 [Potamilus streckersoni]|uniref:Uncharacterized protein n=1 Tax=Potamilus streckersoni TaxID=2493646 RepID=A0AAE0W233_9BIVA|nr:hypothetical protein CHS0354_040176 [Potamilus streckersoni]